LVVNGGFETGDFSGWTISGAGTLGVDYGITNVVPHSGSFAAWFGDPTGLTFLSQVIATVPGQEYEVSFWGANNNQGYPAQNEIQFYWNGTLELDGIDVGTFPWTLEEGTIIATESTTEIKFGFENGPGWSNIDDVNVVPVPEPGTEILCGAALGIVAMCRKRAAASERAGSRRSTPEIEGAVGGNTSAATSASCPAWVTGASRLRSYATAPWWRSRLGFARHRRQNSIRGRFQRLQHPFANWLPEGNRNQRRCTDDHRPGIPKASYPRISSGVRASTTGSAILAQSASTFVRSMGRAVFRSFSSRAAITASLRLTPIRLPTCSARRWAAGFLMYSIGTRQGPALLQQTLSQVLPGAGNHEPGVG
jgi:hypothetical protein